MTEEELIQLKQRFEKASALKSKIESTNEMLNTVRSGECSSIKFSYLEVSDGKRKGEEEGEKYKRTLDLSPRSLDIPEDYYNSLFANNIITQLEVFKGSLEEELANM